jgi:hypothetical protein
MASRSRYSAAEAAFVDADAKLQHHLLEADLESPVGTFRT